MALETRRRWRRAALCTALATGLGGCADDAPNADASASAGETDDAGETEAGPGETEGAETDGTGETGGEPHVPEDGFDEADAMGPIGVRRQTTTELTHSLRYALHATNEELAPLIELLPSDSKTPFDNDYPTQEPSAPLVDGMLKLAETLAEALIADDARRDAVLGCTPAGPGDDACLREGIGNVGRRLLRRSLSAAELDQFAAFGAESAEDGDFGVGLKLALTGLLLHGEFLYRVEIGEPSDQGPDLVRLTDVEMASRLSFLLWGGPPDQALLDLAEGGGLQSPSDIHDAASDMLADDRALAQVQRLHAMWLGYDQLNFDPTLSASLRLETDKLVERALVDGDWMAMFTSEETYLDSTLAEHYDLDLPGGAPGWVEYPDIRRGGLLSHGSFLAIGAKDGDTSPTERGKAVWERILCLEIEPPPANVDVPSGSPNACKDEWFNMRTLPECKTCHIVMDDIGFGLENYGPTGAFRTTEPGKPQCRIQGNGALNIGADAVEFQGAARLGAALVDTGRVEGCFMTNVYQFAIGREFDEDVDTQMVETMTRVFEDASDFENLLLEFASSEGFRHRKIAQN